MRPEFNPIDPALERAIEEIQNEPLDEAAVESAGARVWARLSAELQPASHVIHGCADFQALMPDYRAGRLDEARGMLLKDHTHECVACRKVLEALSAKVTSFPAAVKARPATWRSRPAFRWAAAAAVVIGVGAGSWNVFVNMPDASRERATVASVNGALYRVSNDSAVPLVVGEELPPGAEVRTAKDSDAIVRLADGSLVEMRERSGFSVSATWRDLTINLGHGAVIVEAAKQRKGHLYVSTRDCKVSVTGTVFSVNAGLKGSRVSVVEGEVRVAQNRQEAVLHPGDQYTSSPAVEKLSIEDEIAWSRKLDEHIALLKEFSVLRKQLEQVRLPDLRYNSRLLEVVPANTVIYASIPNLGRSLGEAYQIFRNRIQDSPVLRQWWEEKMAMAQGSTKLDDVVAELRAVSDYIGDEIVVTAPMDEEGHMDAPVLVAEVKRQGLQEFLQAEVTRLGVGSGTSLRFVNSAAEIGSGKGPVVFLRPDVVAISPDTSALQQVAESIEGKRGFANTAFYQRLRQAYRDGAGIVVSADLNRVAGANAKDNNAGARLALGGVQTMLIEQKEMQGQVNTRATFGFSGQRTGIASWLARPAAINALDFVSPEASALGAFVLLNPGTIVDEMFAMLEKSDADFRAKLNETESKLGVDIRRDLAGTLGAEMAFALDGPAFPTPSWKLVVEVYDSARLQSALQRLVEATNQEASAHGQNPGLTMSQEASNGRAYYRISSPAMKKFGDINYTFADGYLVAAPSRTLIDQALSYHANGTGIARTNKFVSLIPRDSYANFSGVLYHDLGSTLGVLVDGVTSAVKLTPEQRKAVQGLAGDMQPVLVAMYAEDDRITVATTSSAFSLSAANLLGMQGPMGIAQMFSQGRPGRVPAVRQ